MKLINAGPGVDRQIVSVDIGKLNEAVGIIHRGPTTGHAAAGGAGAGAASAEPCGERTSTPPAAGAPTGISHDHQTETYIIVSGGGTLVTGGHIVNGRKSAPDSQVTKVADRLGRDPRSPCSPLGRARETLRRRGPFARSESVLWRGRARVQHPHRSSAFVIVFRPCCGPSRQA